MIDVIIVDTREHLIPQIQDLLVTKIVGPDVPQFQFKCLPLADYLLENNGHNILIERKSITDFCGSYRELKPRLAKMRKCEFERIGLLIEGTYTVANGRVFVREGSELVDRMSYKTMSNFLTHQEELGTRLYHTMNLEETIWRIIHIHNYLTKLDEPVPSFKAGSVMEWLSEIPGVGMKSLQEMKEKYPTPLEALMNLPKRSRQLLEKW